MDFQKAIARLAPPLPTTWTIGDAAFDIDITSVHGEFDPERRIGKGLSGRGWYAVPCARPRFVRPQRLFDRVNRFVQAVEVVDDVTHPETQISLDAARALRPGIQPGESIAIDFEAARGELQSILDLGRGIGGALDPRTRAGMLVIEFDDLTVDFSQPHRAQVIEGSAKLKDELRGPVEIVLDGFTIELSALTFGIKGTRGSAKVRLPSGVTDAASCGPAVIDLGTIRVSPTCDYYFDEPEQAYGPWLLGDTGMIVQGTGFVLDLSKTQSPLPGLPASWRGLRLGAGTASGAERIPDPCNSGYLRGDYAFPSAIIVAAGFSGVLELTAPIGFTAINPFGQVFTFSHGTLQVQGSEILMGQLSNGSTAFTVDSVCDRTPGTAVTVDLSLVTVQPDFDLTADVNFGRRNLSWGQLTSVSDEVVVFSSQPDEGNLYLPGGARSTYSPVRSGTYVSPNVYQGWSGNLASLQAGGVSGITFTDLGDLAIASPDGPRGRRRPIKLDQVVGWLRIGSSGVDGTLARYSGPVNTPLGNPASTGYAGKAPFGAMLFAYERQNVIAQFVTSAAYDSHVSGTLAIPAPCNIPNLPFEQLKFTSMASIVGGDIVLPAAGLPLEHWDVRLVPTSTSAPAGVLSVRTGRVLFTAAGIAEPTHFAQPFGLTWGEIFADGSLGELYLDFNDWGQRFDGLVFHPGAVTLSTYDANDKAPYLGVSGDVAFPLFGVHHVNVKDAADKTNGASPFPRHVTVPKTAITPSSAPTDLALTAAWHDVNSAELAHFDCPDVHVDYNEQSQEGFIGTGGAELAFLHSDPLATVIEIHSDATDIRFTSSESHDLDLNVIARFGALSQIAGNLRIEGPTVRSMTVYGMFEQSAAAGVFGAKTGYEIEANMTITPTSFDFYASGDMVLSLALVEIEASGTAHLLFDYARGSAEGEFIGRVDCDAAVAGLSGEGQLTWFFGPHMQYLQGRLKVEVFSLFGGASLEGGFFLGNDVPKELAWALDTTDPKFGMSRALLPATVTGIYGYGRASFAVNYYVLGGGIDIFVGAGAFSAGLSAGGPLSALTGTMPLPFVVGACGVNIHGEILGGLVSASAWANLSMRGPLPPSFEGTFGLEGCVAWVLCASVDITARVSSAGFELV